MFICYYVDLNYGLCYVYGNMDKQKTVEKQKQIMDVNHDQFVLFNTGQILINIDGYGRFMISLSSINYPNKSYPLITKFLIENKIDWDQENRTEQIK